MVTLTLTAPDAEALAAALAALRREHQVVTVDNTISTRTDSTTPPNNVRPLRRRAS